MRDKPPGRLRGRRRPPATRGKITLITVGFSEAAIAAVTASPASAARRCSRSTRPSEASAGMRSMTRPAPGGHPRPRPALRVRRHPARVRSSRGPDSTSSQPAQRLLAAAGRGGPDARACSSHRTAGRAAGWRTGADQRRAAGHSRQRRAAAPTSRTPPGGWGGRSLTCSPSGAFCVRGRRRRQRIVTGAFGERPDHGLQARAGGRPLFVLPSTLPADAAVPLPSEAAVVPGAGRALLDRPPGLTHVSAGSPGTHDGRGAQATWQSWGGETRCQAVDNFPGLGRDDPELRWMHWLWPWIEGCRRAWWERVAGARSTPEVWRSGSRRPRMRSPRGSDDDGSPIDRVARPAPAPLSQNLNANGDAAATGRRRSCIARPRVNMGLVVSEATCSRRPVHLAALDRA